MFVGNVSGSYRSKKEKFDIFLLCYFVILLSLCIFISNKNSGLVLLLVFGWIIFIILLMVERFLIVKMVSNRVIRKVKVFSDRYGLKSGFDNSIVVQYNPPEGVNSAEAGLLLHCYASSIDMFSLLYLWSSKKRITINCEEREGRECIILSKVSDISVDVPKYQSKFFSNLFHNSNEFILTESSEIDNYYDTFDLENYGVSKGRFKSEGLTQFRFPSEKIMITFYIGILFIGVFGSFLLPGFLKFCIGFIIILSMLKYFFKKLHRLKRTEKGDKLVEHLLGFRKYVLSCDEKKFESFLKENPLYYDEILSYAVVFGVETDLMKKLIPILDEDIDPGDGTYGRWNSVGKFS